jgi:hypothetical protein
MSTSIYDQVPKKHELVSPPSSRRRRAYRQEVYGEKTPLSEHGHHHRRHSKKKISLINVILLSLFVVAVVLMVWTIAAGINGMSAPFENSEMKQTESMLLKPKELPENPRKSRSQ